MSKRTFFRVSFSRSRQISFAKSYRNQLHRHSFFEPCIVVSGHGEFEHNGSVHALEPADLFLADPDAVHEIRSLDSRDLCIYFFGFYVTQHPLGKRVSAQAQLMQAAMADFLHEHVQHLPGQWHLIPLFEHALRLARDKQQPLESPFYRDASLLLVNQILVALAGFRESVVDDQHLRLRRCAVEHMEERLHERLRVASIADACGLSERHLRRKWKAWTGRTIVEEINIRRIDRACELLLVPDLSITEIAFQVGIRDAAQFSRLFRRFRHETPGAFRRQYLLGNQAIGESNRPFRTDFVRVLEE
ncbi:MAG: AraC family transcriptional regulator [Pseudomonadota bacterium]